MGELPQSGENHQGTESRRPMISVSTNAKGTTTKLIIIKLLKRDKNHLTSKKKP